MSIPFDLLLGRKTFEIWESDHQFRTRRVQARRSVWHAPLASWNALETSAERLNRSSLGRSAEVFNPDIGVPNTRILCDNGAIAARLIGGIIDPGDEIAGP